MNTNKKVIILWHNGGRLANQLWLFSSVYAYCLEKKYELDNPSFFEYIKDFKNIKIKNPIINIFFVLPFPFLSKKLKRLTIIRLYKIYVKIIELIHKKNIISVSNNNQTAYYLPPSDNSSPAIKNFDENKEKKIYLNGWLFRNPEGLKKYRKEITEYFFPNPQTENEIKQSITNLRNKYSHIVGVHIRQGDYKKEHVDGQLYFSEERVCQILLEYLEKKRKKKENTCFIICSDGPINQKLFGVLNTVARKGSPANDLFTLSATDVIIGADSTFGSFASYYGNIPFIIFKDKIDWEYYKDKNSFFANKYSTMSYF